MAITDFLFPQGNFLNIRANAPNQRAYNIDATADLVRNNPFGILGEIYAPALTAATSIPYDTIQGIGRAVDQSNVGTGPYRGFVDDTEIPRGPSLSDIGQAIDAENPLSSAIGAATPLAERISNISNPFRMSQAAASEVDLSNRNINTTPYQDKIMGGLEGDPNPFGYQNQINDFVIDNEPYQEIPGFNFIDAPTSLKSRLRDTEFFNNPRTGFIDNTLMKSGNPRNTIIDKTKSGIGKGFDLGKAAFSGIASLASGIPFLGNVLTNMFKPTTPEQKDMLEIYDSPEYQEILNQIPGMENYNPVYGMGKGYGLAGAIDKRMSRIAKTLQKKNSEVLQKRLENLKRLKEVEQRAEAERRGQTYTRNANLENIINRATGERDATGGDPGSKGASDQFTGERDATGGDPGSKGASDQFSNRSGRGRTGYIDGGLAGLL
jgi:hypothetical protein